eukprot:1978622-Prymnesium_polylepis.1
MARVGGQPWRLVLGLCLAGACFALAPARNRRTAPCSSDAPTPPARRRTLQRVGRSSSRCRRPWPTLTRRRSSTMARLSSRARTRPTATSPGPWVTRIEAKRVCTSEYSRAETRVA